MKIASTLVKYYNITKQGIRKSHNILPIPEDMNQSDLHIADWLHDTTTVNNYQTDIVNEGSCVPLYVGHLDGYPV